MTAQVIATSGGARIYETGARIQVSPGVAYRIHDVDSAGDEGPCLEPPALQLAANEPEIGDLTVTLPDGTALVFEGMIPLFGTGSGLMGESGDLVVASLEQVAAPAAGGNSNAISESGDGSAAAHNLSTPFEANIFGEAPEGPVLQLPRPTFELEPEEVAIPDLGEEPVVEEVPPKPPKTVDPSSDCVITQDDGAIIINGRSLLSNDLGNGLQIISVQDYSGPGMISLNPDGNVEISAVTANPALDNSAVTETFTYTVRDLDGNEGTTQVTIYVDEVRYLDGDVGNPLLDLGNDKGEIFIPNEHIPGPPAGISIFGGLQDDFLQLRDGQKTNPYGGDGFDTIQADTEFATDYMDFRLPDDFSQANYSIERIDARDEVSNLGISRIQPFENLVEVNWDFSDVELIEIDEIVGRGGNDTIIGSNAADNIYGDGGPTPGTGTGGNDGDDTVNGGAGNDLIHLGGGSDNVVIISNVDNGLDEIQSFDNIGDGDVLDLRDLFNDLELDLGPLSAADRYARIELVFNGGDTEVWIDTDAGDPAGNGDVDGEGRALAGAGDVQIAHIIDNPDLSSLAADWDNGVDLIVA